MTKAMARTALIAGASGLVGGHLLRILLESPEYQQVTALGRRSLNLTHAKLNQQVVDFHHLDPALFRVDDIFCCLGTTIKQAGSQAAFREVDLEYPLSLGRLAKAAGARTYLLVSSMGADTHSRFFYNRVKGEAEEGLKALSLPALHIFRPSLLLGQRQARRLGEEIATVIIKPFMGLMGKYRPIAGVDVARAMYNVARREVPGIHTYESNGVAALAQNEAAR